MLSAVVICLAGLHVIKGYKFKLKCCITNCRIKLNITLSLSFPLLYFEVSGNLVNKMTILFAHYRI